MLGVDFGTLLASPDLELDPRPRYFLQSSRQLASSQGARFPAEFP